MLEHFILLAQVLLLKFKLTIKVSDNMCKNLRFFGFKVINAKILAKT